MRAITASTSRLDNLPAVARLNFCSDLPNVPTTIASPSPSRLLPMIAPVICALTTFAWPAFRMNSARISSATFPNVTFINPPIALPTRSASCSVLFLIHSANGTIASTAVTKTHRDGALIP